MNPQNSNKPILIVDDEPAILRAVGAGLKAQRYVVESASTGEDALQKASASAPQLVILDLMLPGIDGIEVCKRLREWSNVPIIILSAIGNERQKVKALDAGADDYLTKPFGMDELTARVRAALRRYSGGDSEENEPLFESANLAIDYAARIVKKIGLELKLTPLEYDILRYLTLNADRVVTHRQLLSNVWGAEYAEETQILRVHVGNLRKKIEDNPARPKMIVNEPGIGYRFKTVGLEKDEPA